MRLIGQVPNLGAAVALANRSAGDLEVFAMRLDLEALSNPLLVALWRRLYKFVRLR